MAPSINYYCPCELPTNTPPPPPPLASSSSSFHPLHTLFFCEECDAIRCNRCVAIEVSGYYCPNCLFEVPSASVRAEKNRCARNCFLCPHCRNTLSVVPSDPTDESSLRTSTSQLGTLGEPPFLLYCNNCRWDSAEVGITFEKPTGLAQQLQRTEDSAPESLEFERLKEHFDPFLRASAAALSQAPSSSSHHSHTHVNPITAAASSALARDIPGVSKYHPQTRSRARSKNANKDEMPTYRSRVEIGTMSGLGPRGDFDVEKMKHLESPYEVASLEQIWTNSWAVSPLVRELRPLRIPLHSRLTKRCQACRHILIKPEQKAQSVRYKIKLVAANYLPAMTVHLPVVQAISKRVSLAKAPGGEDDGANAGFHTGRTYPFQIALTNPLYDPIQVRLAVQRHLPSAQENTEAAQAEAKARRPPFAVSLPSSAFSIAAFAEAWEYEDDEEMLDALEEDDRLIGGQTPSRSPTKDRKSKAKTVGVLERRANLTVIGGEVVISKEARGNVKFNMLVSYTYRSDEPVISEDERADTKSRTTPNAKAAPEMKTFSFYTVVDLGPIVPREESRAEQAEL